jgi:ribulose-phosphate 3-epimerase
VAVLPETSLEAARPLLEHADHVLIFTGQLGHNGGTFRTDQLARAAQVRQIHPDTEISVDGGVNDLNAALIALQPVDVLYVGQFLQQADDPQAAFESLHHQIEVKT